MIKNILPLSCILMTSLHAMKTVSLVEITKTSLSLIYNGTKINLIKGSWEDATDRIDLTIVGNQQQHMLIEEFDHLDTVGRTYWSYGNRHPIHKRKKEDNSASDDDTYKPYRHIDKQTWRDGQTTKKFTMMIEEPCISDSTRIKRYGFFPDNSNIMQNITIPTQCLNTFVYNCHRDVPNRQDMFYDLCFQGNTAIQEASKDLSLCYTKALIEGLKYFTYSSAKDKNIAFPTLGADVGFPRDKAVPIAIEAIFNFLQDNPNQYNSIHLFVKKRSEFALYKKLLMQRYKPIKVICLLYLMQKDPTQDFSYLPQDVINHIAWFMYNS